MNYEKDLIVIGGDHYANDFMPPPATLTPGIGIPFVAAFAITTNEMLWMKSF